MRRILFQLSALALVGAAFAPPAATGASPEEADDAPPVICWQIVDPGSLADRDELPASAAGSGSWVATVSGRRYMRLGLPVEREATSSRPGVGASLRALEVRSATPQVFLFAPAAFEVRPGRTLDPAQALWVTAYDAGVGVQGIIVRVGEGASPSGAPGTLEIEAADLADNVTRVALPSLEPVFELVADRFCSLRRVVVPRVVDLEPSAARELLEERKLALEIAGETREPPAAAVLRIVDQEPAAGVEVLPESTVRSVVVGFCQVPDVVDRTVEEARQALRQRGLGLTESAPRRTTLTTGVVYRVLSQDPGPGSELTVGQTVRVEVVTLLPVPALSGMEIERARRALLASGLRWQGETARPELSGEVVRVLGQSPSPGSLVPADSTVRMELVRSVRVPGLVGLDLEAARRALASRGLELTPDEGIAEHPDGSLFELVEQSPARGTEVVPGSSVAARFAALVPVPEVRGLSFPEARQALAASGLALGATGWRVGGALDSLIVGQGQQAGAHVPPGTPINLSLSRPYLENEITWPWQWIAIVMLLGAALRTLRRPVPKFEVKGDADLAGLSQSVQPRGGGDRFQLDIRLRPVFDAGVQTLSIDAKE